MMKELATTNHKVFDELVRRILKVVKPKRLILFGSAVRGEMKPETDRDGNVAARAPRSWASP